jgi:flagellar motor switch/type III secretory pathway protein FliN
VSKQLSAAEIDALLTSLRRAQDGEGPPDAGAEAAGTETASGAPETGALPGGPRPARGGELPIRDVEFEASVYVGGGVYRLSTLAALRPGAVLPLSTDAGEPALIAVGDRVIAYGEIMVAEDDTLAVRLTRVLLGEEGRRSAPAWLEGARGVGPEAPPRAPAGGR